MSASVQVVDGHFSPPIGKIDVLKAPKNFPVPVMRYVLGEMTLIWEIFGGQDFSKSTSSSNARFVLTYNGSTKRSSLMLHFTAVPFFR